MEPPLTLTRQQVRRVDQIAIDQYGIPGIVLMENAGRGVVDTLCQLGVAGPVVIACGKGNNAGDGFVIARHLMLRGVNARVLLWAEPEELAGDAATNYQILAKTDVLIDVFGPEHDQQRLAECIAGADWIVDALLGTGATGQPRSPLDTVIKALNQSPARRLAVDLPSGLDCDTGATAEQTFRADHTCTFVAYKPGLLVAEAALYVGQVHVLDIGAPRCVIDAALRS
jgi:NAD(P)H-hydrate epimerase